MLQINRIANMIALHKRFAEQVVSAAINFCFRAMEQSGSNTRTSPRMVVTQGPTIPPVIMPVGRFSRRKPFSK